MMSVGHNYSHQQSHHGCHGDTLHNHNDASSYDVWNNFFSSAGIPDSVAHDYAVTFSQHRIKIDMLTEITKDILLDMGIKAMGDIIAILRHAKDLCTQNELKSIGGHKTSISSTAKIPMATHGSSPTHQSSSIKSLSQRMPISTSRSGSNISSLVGSRIQSRLNLSSGALVASSNNDSNSNNLSLQHHLNKRPSSTISTSLAKRLRPSPNNSAREVPRELPEKTLVVHYPSSSAIARAQQRISGTIAQPTNSGPNISSSSIRSRLGTTIETVKTRSERNSLDSNKNLNINNNNYKGIVAQKIKSDLHPRPSTNNSPNNYRTNSTIERSDSRDKPRRETDSGSSRQNRPKSTVFSRLGETSR